MVASPSPSSPNNGAAAVMAAAACRVWIRSTTPPTRTISLAPCSFGKSMFDSLLFSASASSSLGNSKGSITQIESPSHKHYDRQRICLWEDAASGSSSSRNISGVFRVILEEALLSLEAGHDEQQQQQQQEKTESKTAEKMILPMGRARLCPQLGSTSCPTTIKPVPEQPPRNKPHPQLAVVGLVLDHSGQHVLLTRRPHYMRSFPGAWVLPGGGFDGDTDKSLEDTLRREVLEETGLVLTTSYNNNNNNNNIQPVCIWESVYPTTPDHPGPIKAHHLVVFLQGTVEAGSDGNKQEEGDDGDVTDNAVHTKVRLQDEEVTSAVWISVQDFQRVLNTMNTNFNNNEHESKTNNEELPTIVAYQRDGSTMELSLRTLVGIYPQPDQDTARTQQEWCGIAQGSLFALQELLLRSHSGKDDSSLSPSSWLSSVSKL